ncbi:thrombin-like enzyme bothrombin [Cimex lectularius]|uniref:Peptidase S1 domain-containing protein n=1 Tax=Cimex lectularius TaxID=79782 RepID=A0A8I6R8C3_CIMLE|nr:thrombin-like enzyme bothrombin [Cimex lectularius]
MVFLLFIFIVGLNSGLIYSYNLSAYYETYDASVYDYPFVALVITAKGLGCTAVIITRFWLISSASCIGSVKYAKRIRIIAGVDNLDSSPAMINDSLHRNVIQARKGMKAFNHPHYKDGKLMQHDISLIRIARSFKTTKTVKPLGLKPEFWPPEELKVCVVVGWLVKIGTKNFKRRLQYFYAYAKFGHYSCPCINEGRNIRSICLERDGGGLCPGDAGAALVCDGAIVGLSHALIDTKCMFTQAEMFRDCQKFGFATAFTDICYMLPWIDSLDKISGILPQQCVLTPFYMGETTKIFVILVIVFLFSVSYAYSAM